MSRIFFDKNVGGLIRRDVGREGVLEGAILNPPLLQCYKKPLLFFQG